MDVVLLRRRWRIDEEYDSKAIRGGGLVEAP